MFCIAQLEIIGRMVGEMGVGDGLNLMLAFQVNILSDCLSFDLRLTRESSELGRLIKTAYGYGSILLKANP